MCSPYGDIMISTLTTCIINKSPVLGIPLLQGMHRATNQNKKAEEIMLIGRDK